MESKAHRDVEEVRRRQLDVYRSQVTPGWAWPSLAVAMFLFLSSYEVHSTWVKIAVALTYALFVGVWIGLITRRSGVQPRLRGMPKPLFGELVRYWVAAAIVGGAVVAVGLTISWVLAGGLAAVAIVVGGKYFDRRYRRRADALAACVPAPQQ